MCHYGNDTEGRNPTLLLVLDGDSKPRLAERQSAAWLRKLPPRMTRHPVPESTQSGSVAQIDSA